MKKSLCRFLYSLSGVLVYVICMMVSLFFISKFKTGLIAVFIATFASSYLAVEWIEEISATRAWKIVSHLWIIIYLIVLVIVRSVDNDWFFVCISSVSLLLILLSLFAIIYVKK